MLPPISDSDSMLTWLNFLFGGNNELILRGVAEAHPATKLENALYVLGAGLNTNTEPVAESMMQTLARNRKAEIEFWHSWEDYARNTRANPEVRAWALNEISQAGSISLGERSLVTSLLPENLYLEGCREMPSSVIGFVAENLGINVIYLDKGFRPYLEWLRNRGDKQVVQKGREYHWAGRVGQNPPRGTSLTIVGRNHLIRPSPRSVAENPAHAYIGNFPRLLGQIGIKYRFFADFSGPYSTHGTMQMAANRHGF